MFSPPCFYSWSRLNLPHRKKRSNPPLTFFSGICFSAAKASENYTLASSKGYRKIDLDAISTRFFRRPAGRQNVV